MSLAKGWPEGGTRGGGGGGRVERAAIRCKGDTKRGEEVEGRGEVGRGGREKGEERRKERRATTKKKRRCTSVGFEMR